MASKWHLDGLGYLTENYAKIYSKYKTKKAREMAIINKTGQQRNSLSNDICFCASVEKKRYSKKEESFSEFLFVYGSLKKGFDNHNLLDGYAKRIGEAYTVDKFAMYEDSFGNYPYLIQKPIAEIRGELYEIRKRELLDKIDEFEGAPEYYQRKQIRVKTNKGIKQAFVYIRENEEIPKGQELLTIWENNTHYKVRKFDRFLECLH